MRQRIILILLALLLSVGVLAEHDYAHSRDHDRSRRAVQAGEIMPLKTVLERVEQHYPGQVLGVELESNKTPESTLWVYEIKILGMDGRLVKLLVDAQTAKILGIKQKPQREHKYASPDRRR